MTFCKGTATAIGLYLRAVAWDMSGLDGLLVVMSMILNSSLAGIGLKDARLQTTTLHSLSLLVIPDTRPAIASYNVDQESKVEVDQHGILIFRISILTPSLTSSLKHGLKPYDVAWRA